MLAFDPFMTYGLGYPDMAGIAIDSAEFGWDMSKADNLDVHARGWNREWHTWLKNEWAKEGDILSQATQRAMSQIDVQ